MAGEKRVRAYLNGAFDGAFEDITGACLKYGLKRQRVLRILNESGVFTRGTRLEIVFRGTPAGVFEEKLRLLTTLARSTEGARAVIDETIRRLMAIRSGESLDWNAEKKGQKK
jgi:hypothetical protein